ncbi:hypothetical protein B0I35DRAFT_415864 [Stachybotrys elegans]|uniref:Transcription initiation factor IIF subunit alpha n=1 Tax=Stachybotrys elegans TaxID=80388 RepID=A0A8K0T5M2_9HYPO|nr:hypothetical protein B0I35DRAFT_415864 [Stachybotrys elegans]
MSGAPPPDPNTQRTRKPNKANPLRPLRKQPRPVNPLVSGRKPGVKPTASKGPVPNGSKPSLDELRAKYNGWSEPPPESGYTDIPIMTTKKALLSGIRYHLMKFSQAKLGDQPVDPTDQNEFARPVTLHRRDARQPPPGRAVKQEEAPPPQVDEQEAERLAQIKAQKEAQKAIDQAKIAPVAKDPTPKQAPRPKKQKEDRTMFNRAPKTEAAKKESDLRYEEALPWHLEDADGKNVWVGSYIAALSEANVAFMIDQSVFRMVPLEKWYKFTSKPPFQPFTIDEAEAFMSRKVDVGRWVMKDEERRAGQSDLEATRRMLYGPGRMIKTESSTFKAASRSEKLEHDELDVSGDEFQDDDEAPTFERNDDEDTKESNTRIRREQLGANTFGEGDEQEVDKELEEQLKEELERKKFGSQTKKALIKRDHEHIYESDKSENPWTSSSEDDSSDNEEDDEEKKDADGKDGQEEGGKDKSKGSGAPSGSQGKQKSGEPQKKSNALKRAGSPALSESSGNESSRKKIKKSATASGSRSGTPLPQQAAARRSKLGAGSGSDGEGTAGEMSDGAVARKKIKAVGSAGKGSPVVSRAGSPNPPSGGQGSASPLPGGGSVIEPQEILDRIPAEGIIIGELIKPFQGRVGDRPGQMPKGEWIKLVRQLCDYGPDKRLRRRK